MSQRLYNGQCHGCVYHHNVVICLGGLFLNWKITPDNDSITRCKDDLGVGVFRHGTIHTTLPGVLGDRVTGITTCKDDESTEVIIFQNRTPQQIRSVHIET